jgi:hypothetical protein
MEVVWRLAWAFGLGSSELPALAVATCLAQELHGIEVYFR